MKTTSFEMVFIIRDFYEKTSGDVSVSFSNDYGCSYICGRD